MGPQTRGGEDQVEKGDKQRAEDPHPPGASARLRLCPLPCRVFELDRGPPLPLMPSPRGSPQGSSRWARAQGAAPCSLPHICFPTRGACAWTSCQMFCGTDGSTDDTVYLPFLALFRKGVEAWGGSAVKPISLVAPVAVDR